MIIVLLLAFFLAFAASVITTLRRTKARPRRASSRCTLQGVALWIDSTLAGTTLAHNIVSELKEGAYSGPIRVHRLDEDATPSAGEQTWLALLVSTEGVPDLSILPARCHAAYILIRGADAKDESVEPLQAHLQRLAVPELIPPVGAQSLSNPQGLAAFCRKLVTLLSGQQPSPLSRTSLSSTSWESIASQTGSADASPPKSKIYTRTGDKGKTSLYNGSRVPKTHAIIRALGDTDELTSNIGVAMEHCRSIGGLGDMVEQLVFIQCRLQELNSHIAAPGADGKASSTTEFDADGGHAKQLERWIDALDAQLPALTRFILPSGGLASAHLHVARAVCRRAERAIHGVIEAGGGSAEAGRFLNRLSDYLFTAARFACQRSGNSEVCYQKPK